MLGLKNPGHTVVQGFQVVQLEELVPRLLVSSGGGGDGNILGAELLDVEPEFSAWLTWRLNSLTLHMTSVNNMFTASSMLVMGPWSSCKVEQALYCTKSTSARPFWRQLGGD